MLASSLTRHLSSAASQLRAHRYLLPKGFAVSVYTAGPPALCPSCALETFGVLPQSVPMLASHCTQWWVGMCVWGAPGSKQHSGRGRLDPQNIRGDWSWQDTPGALLANTLGLRRQWQPLLPHNSLLNPRGSWCHAGFEHIGSRAQAWGVSFHFSRVRKGWEMIHSYLGPVCVCTGMPHSCLPVSLCTLGSSGLVSLWHPCLVPPGPPRLGS